MEGTMSFFANWPENEKNFINLVSLQILMVFI